ncbi:MAG: alanine/ornithine racemase family PLP-dependent enzyme [Tissierellia bacterium]|nr:alanine/ornithine racemase family PLP-dependent enzyme [Tissierellia bacterium]
MTYPRILINTTIIENNVRQVVKMAEEHGIHLAGVTKGFCAYPEIVQAYVNGGVAYLADSRMINLKKIAHFKLPKILLRLPMISEVDELVQYATISLNSELATIKAISHAAQKRDKIHGIILMVDLGDLREGYFNLEELYADIKVILGLKGVKLLGIGSNLTCYGGVIPDNTTLNRLNQIKVKIEADYNISLDIVSGGNSSSLHLLKDHRLIGINNLRIGESFIFGTESGYGQQLEGTNAHAFTIQAEIIEIKDKPSVPKGEIGLDAFGKTPTFVDRGVRKRILAAIGKQDIDLATLYPFDQDLIILGGSSDHLILDAENSKLEYMVGDILEFNIHYVSLLRAMTSEYIEKVVKNS